MTKKIKILLFVLNCLGIVLVFLLGNVVFAIHETHAFSMYREFDSRGIVNKEAVAEVRKSYPGEKDYDVLKRMQQIGGVRHHLRTMGMLVSAIFLLNMWIVLLVPVSRAVRKEENADSCGASLES